VCVLRGEGKKEDGVKASPKYNFPWEKFSHRPICGSLRKLHVFNKK